MLPILIGYVGGYTETSKWAILRQIVLFMLGFALVLTTLGIVASFLGMTMAALVGHGRRLVLVRDQDLEAPRGAVLDLRGQGLWMSVTCETPLEHWSVGLEAFAVGFDDPLEAWGTERGDLVGLAFDLEWEASGPADSSTRAHTR